MALDPLAIATQGLGFDALLVAVQGLLDPVGAAPESGAGGGSTVRRRVRRGIVRPLAAAFGPDPQDDDLVALRLLGLLP